VTPTKQHPPVSLEDYLKVIIEGQGFKCQKVTDIVQIKPGELYQAICGDEKYKMVKHKDGSFTVTPW